MAAKESSTRQALGQLYSGSFNPDDYIATYYSALDPEVEFFLSNLHRFFDEHAPGDDESTAEPWRVLEVGSGPVPISMISASRRSEWIVCSDFLEQNRQKMARWLTPGRGDGDERDPAWLLPFFRYVAQLERANSEIGLVERVRRSVRAVVPCDVFSADLLGVNGGDKESYCRGPFDFIISTLCLEFASLTPADYTTAVTNTASLLAPGAYLILQGALGNSHYWLGGRSFPSVRLDRQLIEASLGSAGCRIVDWRELGRCCPCEDKPADHSGVFYCVARRMRN